MALSPTQEDLLLKVIQENFPNDSPSDLLLRIFRFLVRNNPSAAQKTALQALITNSVNTRAATLSTFDAVEATRKTAITTEQTNINGLPGSL